MRNLSLISLSLVLLFTYSCSNDDVEINPNLERVQVFVNDEEFEKSGTLGVYFAKDSSTQHFEMSVYHHENEQGVRWKLIIPSDMDLVNTFPIAHSDSLTNSKIEVHYDGFNPFFFYKNYTCASTIGFVTITSFNEGERTVSGYFESNLCNREDSNDMVQIRGSFENYQLR